MDTSVFMDKTKMPAEVDLRIALALFYEDWKSIRDYTFQQYPTATEEWYIAGAKYGWAFRIKDKKRAIVYLSPREQYFKVSFVFGEKATKQALISNIKPETKTIIETAPVYMEGRGIRLTVDLSGMLNDIKALIDIKIAN
jgi:hypothetical protein